MERLDVSYTFGSSESMVRIGKDRIAPRHFTARWDDGDPDTPTVTATFEVRDGIPQCREVRITSADAGREVQASDGRKLRIADWLEDALAISAMPYGGKSGATTRWDAPRPTDGKETVQQVRMVRREARRRITDEMLQEVAEVYRANIGRGPTEAVAARFGKSHRTAGHYVKQARAAGYLGEAMPGKAGER